MTFRERVLAFAASWENVHEEPRGSNRGPMVDQFLREAGVRPGLPWCLAFAYACAHHAAMHAHIPTPILQTASCANLYGWARRNGRLTAQPHPGDIGLLRGGPLGHHHAVLVTEILPGMLVQTIEGNSDSMGGDEGWRVARHKRSTTGMDFVSVEEKPVS